MDRYQETVDKPINCEQKILVINVSFYPVTKTNKTWCLSVKTGVQRVNLLPIRVVKMNQEFGRERSMFTIVFITVKSRFLSMS